VRIARIDQITTFVTDHCPSERFRAQCRAAGVELIEAE
jgi:DeoR family glycerol-3-phosphate regulon repressor